MTAEKIQTTSAGTATHGRPFAASQVLERSTWYLGWLMTTLAGSADTQGKFTLMEIHSGPGNDPPLHIHHHEDETFCLLEGAMTFYVGTQEIKATGGTTVFLPRGVPHRFEVKSPRVKALLLLAPGGLEGFFSEIGEPAQALTIPAQPENLDIRKIIEVSDKYGIEFV